MTTSNRFKITFNKPAVRQFIDGDSKGLQIKTEGGLVMFKAVSSATGKDTAELEQRTRGGYEANIQGSGADSLLKRLQNDAGPFFLLKKGSKGHAIVEPYTGAGAPPKLEPHVRVWTPKETPDSKPTARTAPAPQAAHSLPATGNGDYMDSVRAAYEKLAEPRRPGRPSKDVLDARELVNNFERSAAELIQPKAKEQPVNFGKLIEAHQMIGDFLARVMPNGETNEAVEGAPPAEQPAAEAPAPVAEAPVSDAAAADAAVVMDSFLATEDTVAPKARRAKALKPNAGTGKPKTKRARKGKAEATSEAPKARRGRKPKVVAEVGKTEALADAEAPKARSVRKAKDAPAPVQSQSADDEEAAGHLKQALAKLGLEEAEPKPTKRSRRAAPVHA